MAGRRRVESAAGACEERASGGARTPGDATPAPDRNGTKNARSVTTKPPQRSGLSPESPPKEKPPRFNLAASCICNCFPFNYLSTFNVSFVNITSSTPELSACIVIPLAGVFITTI